MLFSLPTWAIAGAQSWRTSTLLVCFGGLCVVRSLGLKAMHWTQGGTKQQRIQPRQLPSPCSAEGWASHNEKGESLPHRGPETSVSMSRRQRCLPKFFIYRRCHPSSVTSSGHLTHCPTVPRSSCTQKWSVCDSPAWVGVGGRQGKAPQEALLEKPEFKESPISQEIGNRYYLLILMKRCWLWTSAHWWPEQRSGLCGKSGHISI